MKKIHILALVLVTVGVLTGCSNKMPSNTVYSVADLSGADIGVMQGAVAATYTSSYGTLHTYQAPETALVEVKNGILDCAVLDEAVAKTTIKQVSGLEILPDALMEGDFCFAIAKENFDLTTAVNASLKILSEDGTLEKMIDGYVQGGDYRYISPENADHSAGTLILAVDANFSPYSFKNDAGEPVGLDIDIARAVCDMLHVAMKVTVVDRIDLVKTVQYGKADFSLGGITSSEEVAKLVDLSDPYVNCKQVIVVRK